MPWVDIGRNIVVPFAFVAFAVYLIILRSRFAKQNAYLEKMNSTLERHSTIDDMTGLINRIHLEFEIEREIERARRYHRPLSGLMVDIDNFNQVNERYGHLTGDVVLTQMASMLRQGIRKIDIVGRYGGDKFIIVLPEATLEGAKVVAARIQEGVRAFSANPPVPQLAVTVSIGLFFFQEVEKLTKVAFMEKVDLAMLKAK